MTTKQIRRQIHDLDVTLRVGKHGIDSVVDELSSQLDDADLVKVKFLRASRGGTTAEELAADLGERVNAELLQTRGHTAVYRR